MNNTNGLPGRRIETAGEFVDVVTKNRHWDFAILLLAVGVGGIILWQGHGTAGVIVAGFLVLWRWTIKPLVKRAADALLPGAVKAPPQPKL